VRKRTDLEIIEVNNGFIVRPVANYNRGEICNEGDMNVFTKPDRLADFIKDFYETEKESTHGNE